MSDEHDKEIQNLKASPNDAAEFYKKFPRDMTLAFDSVTKFSRDLNVVLNASEIVVVGKSGQGKTSFIEGLIGQPFLPIEATHRPISIHFINSPDLEKPVVTLKKDALLPEFGSDVTFSDSLEDLPVQIQKRNQKISGVPIQLEFKSKLVDSLTIIDTPGLKSDGSAEEIIEREKIASELAKQGQRTLVCVQNAGEWEKMEIIEFAKKFDPKLTRSLFVFTKFYDYLTKFNSSRELNQFFSKKPAEIRCFFVSLFSAAVRGECLKNPSKFGILAFQAWKYDFQKLEELKFDKRYDSQVGLNLVVNYFRELHWRTYKDILPELKKQMTAMRKTSNDTLKKIQDQFGALDVYMLRTLVSNYVADWIQVVIQLIDGSNEGNLQSNGQTMEEEATNYDFVDWITSNNNVITIHPYEHKIRGYEIKLYGGPQLERLLSVFKAVLSLPEINEINEKDLEDANTVAIYQKTPLAETSLVATHIVRNKIHKLQPLIHQLCINATAVMKRLGDIAFFAMESRGASKRGKGKEENLQSMQGFPYFSAMLRDFYYEFLDNLRQRTLSKCLEEINQSDFIYFEDIKSLETLAKKENDPQKRLKNLAGELMKKMVDDCLVNISMKVHHFFVVICSRDISGEILKHVSSFDDKLLEEMFEMKTSKQQLESEEAKETALLNSYTEKEQKIRDLSSQLLRFKLVA